MAKMKWYDWTAYVLLVVGGINWGLGLWGVNLVGYVPVVLGKVVYGLIGVSGLYGAYMISKLV